MLLAERKALRLAKIVFTCSEHDARYLRRLFGLRNVRVVPNAVEVDPSPPTSAGPRRLMFIGALEYGPNAVAAERLVGRIWPRIAAAVSDAELLIVGNGAEHVVSSRNPPPRVRFTGFVPGLDAVYSGIRVLACPLTYGGGTRVKIVEAAARGKAIVSTRVGAEGLDFVDGESIVLRDGDESIARACIELLTNDELALRLARAAHGRALERYDRPAVVRELTRDLREISGPPRSSVGAARCR